MGRRLLRPAAVLAVAAVTVAAARGGPREACDYSARLQGVTCVVMVDGRVVHEHYRQPDDAGRAWRLASGTKSFAGVIAAAAVQDGRLDLDERVSDTLAAWRTDGRRDITVRQLLGLVSGIDTPAPGRGGRIAAEDAPTQRLAHPPGTRFAYGQAPFQVFAAVMARKLSGERVEDYLHRRVLDPLGVTLAFPGMEPGRDGPDWGGGGAMTARDWARFGEFVRLGGRQDGVARVDPTALAQLFVGSAVHPGYGLTWWIKPPPGAAVPVEGTLANATDFLGGGADALPVREVWMAAGAGRQRLLIVPERRMVAVRQTASLLGAGRAGFSDVEFLRLLLDAP